MNTTPTVPERTVRITRSGRVHDQTPSQPKIRTAEPHQPPIEKSDSLRISMRISSQLIYAEWIFGATG